MMETYLIAIISGSTHAPGYRQTFQEPHVILLLRDGLSEQLAHHSRWLHNNDDTDNGQTSSARAIKTQSTQPTHSFETDDDQNESGGNIQ